VAHFRKKISLEKEMIEQSHGRKTRNFHHFSSSVDQRLLDWRIVYSRAELLLPAEKLRHHVPKG
jgi:hypothetical protein